MQVWGGCLGRLPKRSMLASTPPPPHLTGHLFVIDLAAVDRGWAMVRAAAIHSEGLLEGVPLRKWAAMAELAPGSCSSAILCGGMLRSQCSAVSTSCMCQAQQHGRRCAMRLPAALSAVCKYLGGNAGRWVQGALWCTAGWQTSWSATTRLC